ncbi:S8 family serine peptidase [Piscinibacter sakaiensis]|uniref:S8 family serine peptidase n=1 Tax=Piscinibacter sakaiensis TaxID=1547922 RepID=UPI003AAA8A44
MDFVSFPPRQVRRLRGAVWLAGWLLACAAAPAAAQLGLPGGGGVALPGLGGITGPVGGQIRSLQESRPVDSVASALPLRELRRRTIDDLLSRHREVVERDPAGEPVVRAELLLLAPTEAQLAAAQAGGFVVLREQSMPELGLRHVVLQPPPGLATVDAMARLRAIDPSIEADFNHLYLRSGSVDERPPASVTAARVLATTTRIGLIDGGIDAAHPALRGATQRVSGCDGKAVPSAHGTAVASLLAGRDGAFAGAAPGAMLYAADIYCGRPDGGTAEAVATALGWMARERVAVVNVSLVGPPNKLLARAVAAVIERGHIVVAAVGNDGPAAPLLYPAAFPGVVGVTGVDRRRAVLPEAAQGAHVMLAAPGAELAVAQLSTSDYVAARGTSFAAPLVAGLLAARLRDPDPAAARAAVAALQREAIDLGAPGRDPVFGVGLVAEPMRVDPRRLQLLLGKTH